MAPPVLDMTVRRAHQPNDTASIGAGPLPSPYILLPNGANFRWWGGGVVGRWVVTVVDCALRLSQVLSHQRRGGILPVVEGAFGHIGAQPVQRGLGIGRQVQ